LLELPFLGIFGYLLVLHSPTSYSWVLEICVAVVLSGFAYCVFKYEIKRRDIRNEIKASQVDATNETQRNNIFPYILNAFPFLVSDEPKRHEHKTRAFGFIFGFLASLAITNALRTYYDQYIKVLPYLAIPGLINIMSENPLPSMRLISFFTVAVPLAHSGYVFLSSLNLASVRYIIEEMEKRDKEKHKEPEKPRRRLIAKGTNSAAGLVAIFIISIIQVGFLFLLGGSVANMSEHETDRDKTTQVAITSSTGQ
jgi:hypothetical protein